MPDRWNINYEVNGQKAARLPTIILNEAGQEGRRQLQFRLALTSFKHIGIFPEQAVNWDYISESISLMKIDKPKFLNLFAYTGAASLAAKAAGADVTHLDSIKQVVTWARENMESSGLTDIRWIVEDALKFVKREVKRGNKYHGVILDPPAYGNGPDGEKWKLEDNIQEMMKNILQLLDEKNHFLILNVYSLGFSPVIIENLLKDFARQNDGAGQAKDKLETGELYLQSKTNIKLPLGVFGRFRSLPQP